jgi:hypothetical protein
MLVAGGLFASNMGFKLNYPLTGPGAAPIDGTNTLGLPYNQQTNLLDVEDLLADINATAGGNVVVSIQRFVKATGGLETYTPAGGTNFPLTAGEGYRVKVNAPVNYIIVGSHDPTLTLTLTGPAAAPVDGTNEFAFPYHGVASNADELLQEINTQAAAAAVVSIQRFVKSTGGLETYTPAGGVNFPMVPGEAYRVKVNQNVNYQPDHY